MRLRDQSAALCHLVPLILVVVMATPVFAQFREVPAGPSTSAAAGGLVPTRQPFVTPHAVVKPEPTKTAEDTPAQQATAPVVSREPTPALQPAGSGSAPVENGPATADAAATAPAGAVPEVRPMQPWAAFQPASQCGDRAAAPRPLRKCSPRR